MIKPDQPPTEKLQVPNVPCGVESSLIFYRLVFLINTCVPNVPCGVESLAFLVKIAKIISWFLMYRVELKDVKVFCFVFAYSVGVFLMYRVELKVCIKQACKFFLFFPFLMYRVELKGAHFPRQVSFLWERS